MGLTRRKLKVKKDATSRASREVEFLVDSGAVHSVVPADVLRTLRVKPFKKLSFILANRVSVERRVGTAHFIYRGNEGGAAVVFGEKGDSTLLGATTLEVLELALNPLTRELYPLQMTLMGNASCWVPGGRRRPAAGRRRIMER